MLNPTHEPSSTVAVESKLHASGSSQPTQNNASFSTERGLSAEI
jgi:hypothetical protein